MDIPWKVVFKWLSIEDFIKLNEDPRLLPLDPTSYVDTDWLRKLNSGR